MDKLATSLSYEITMRPKVFIGSSSEGEPYSQAIHDQLEDIAEPTYWRNIFELSGTTMGSLTRVLDGFEYAIFLLSPDDKVTSRQVEQITARDNLFLEMGLFAARLGIERVFFAVPKSFTNFKLPSDLKGITYGQFNDTRSDGNYREATMRFCIDVRKSIEND